MSAEAKTAAEALLADSLAADKDPVLVRALRGNTKAKDASKDEATTFLQSITLKAAAKMIEVVQNHTPHVMVIDEIGRSQEVSAAKTTKQRGVRCVASAHGDLRKPVKNGQLNGLVGGIETVTVGDMVAAKHRAGRRWPSAQRRPRWRWS